MNTRDLVREQITTPVRREERPRGAVDQQYPQSPNVRTIEATAHTGEPARSFKMSFQHEEFARFRSQEMRDHADRSRLVRDARLARRMRRQTEAGARRARRTLVSMLLSD